MDLVSSNLGSNHAPNLKWASRSARQILKLLAGLPELYMRPNYYYLFLPKLYMFKASLRKTSDNNSQLYVHIASSH